jgi:hypothetical protein
MMHLPCRALRRITEASGLPPTALRAGFDRTRIPGATWLTVSATAQSTLEILYSISILQARNWTGARAGMLPSTSYHLTATARCTTFVTSHNAPGRLRTTPTFDIISLTPQ